MARRSAEASASSASRRPSDLPKRIETRQLPRANCTTSELAWSKQKLLFVYQKYPNMSCTKIYQKYPKIYQKHPNINHRLRVLVLPLALKKLPRCEAFVDPPRRLDDTGERCFFFGWRFGFFATEERCFSCSVLRRFLFELSQRFYGISRVFYGFALLSGWFLAMFGFT